MRKEFCALFILVMCITPIGVTQAQTQAMTDPNSDTVVEKGLKDSFSKSASVIDGDGYLIIETGLKGKAAPVERTGQTTSYATGDDGDLQRGAIWPDPRFSDHGNGTVTDNLTGLIWLKDADCFGKRSWADALSDCNGLGPGNCGLSDGSSAGDWRLPNRKELDSLIDLGFDDPALSNTSGMGQWEAGDPFTDVQPAGYWSSTTSASDSSHAWTLFLVAGSPDNTFLKTSASSYVWPVRGGQ